MTKKTEVHNVWAIHATNPDGTMAKKGFAFPSRPQDWGDPRWSYHQFRFDWITEDEHFINHCHCWTDLKLESGGYPGFFAQLITQISIPGEPKELCGRSHLDEDDVWNDDWGEVPPFYEDDEPWIII